MQVVMYKIIKFELWSFAVQLFYRFTVFSVKSLILIAYLKRIKKHYQIPYTHIIIMTIKSTIFYCAVFIQEHKIKCRGN